MSGKDIQSSAASSPATNNNIEEKKRMLTLPLSHNVDSTTTSSISNSTSTTSANSNEPNMSLTAAFKNNTENNNNNKTIDTTSSSNNNNNKPSLNSSPLSFANVPTKKKTTVFSPKHGLVSVESQMINNKELIENLADPTSTPLINKMLIECGLDTTLKTPGSAIKLLTPNGSINFSSLLGSTGLTPGVQLNTPKFETNHVSLTNSLLAAANGTNYNYSQTANSSTSSLPVPSNNGLLMTSISTDSTGITPNNIINPSYIFEPSMNTTNPTNTTANNSNLELQPPPQVYHSNHQQQPILHHVNASNIHSNNLLAPQNTEIKYTELTNATSSNPVGATYLNGVGIKRPNDELQTVPEIKNGRGIKRRASKIKSIPTEPVPLNPVMTSTANQMMNMNNSSYYNTTSGGNMTTISMESSSAGSSLAGTSNGGGGGYVNTRRDTENSMMSTVSSIDSNDAYSPMNPDDPETVKLEKKRERNRIAAQKCRTRKLEKIEGLEKQVKTLTEANEQQRIKSRQLLDEINQLKRKLELHQQQHHCDLKVV